MKEIIIREYNSLDCEYLLKLFYDTVHRVNAKDYTTEQLNVWATGKVNFEKWNLSFKKNYTLVAIEDNIIVGFGDIDNKGYLNRLYTHKDYQRKGVATAICNELEQKVGGNIITHSSITARFFFEKRGYTVIKRQQVEREGVLLTNYVMEKHN